MPDAPTTESATEKPVYAVPSMTATRDVSWNGLTHVSTFSGGGGTCIGFRMAGYKTLWANDVNDHARACYSRNLRTPVHDGDIRTIVAADILRSTGLSVGELDVFEGSPPCTAFSTAGKREKGWGQRKEHAGIVQSSVEDLFFEWLRLVEGLRPRIFAAENVSGMVKGTAKGYFKEVLRRMKALGYRTEARLLDAQWLGVPQARVRVIFVGVRDDLGVAPLFPKPMPYRYSVKDALPWLVSARYDMKGQYAGVDEFVDRPSPSIIGGAEQASRNAAHYTVVDGEEELVDQIVGNDGFEPVFGSADQPHPTIMRSGSRTSGEIRVRVLHREGGYGETDVTGRPSRTLTNQSELSVERGLVRRKFTIPEIKRICSFPDDYEMAGTYAQQWAVMGNSVPPLMARAVACTLRDALLAAR